MLPEINLLGLLWCLYTFHCGGVFLFLWPLLVFSKATLFCKMLGTHIGNCNRLKNSRVLRRVRQFNATSGAKVD